MRIADIELNCGDQKAVSQGGSPLVSSYLYKLIEAMVSNGIGQFIDAWAICSKPI